MKKQSNRLYNFLKVIYSFLLKILYKPQVFGEENIPDYGSIIFVGNHKHAADPVMVMSSTHRIIHFMAKEELFRGIHGIIFNKIGIIKIHKNKSNPVAVIEAERILNIGGAVGIFPEGTRNRTEKELLKFRHGAVSIAQKANSKIIPFAIKGQYKLFKKSVILRFGKPKDICKMNPEEANEYIKSEVLRLLRK